MSSENAVTNSAPSAQKGSVWSDNEKIALLISINKSLGGAVKWPALQIPAGRTIGTCQKQYERLLKTAALVPMSGDLAPATNPGSGQKRKATAINEGVEDEGDTAAKPAKKRAGRKPKVADDPGDANHVEGEEKPSVAKRGCKPKALAKVAARPIDDEGEEGDVKKEDGSEGEEVAVTFADGENETLGEAEVV